MIKTVTGTLSIGYCESSLALSQQGEVVWTSATSFSYILILPNIQLYLRIKHNLLVGEPTAEKVLTAIGSPTRSEDEIAYQVKGRNIVSGVPAAIEVNSTEIRDQIKWPVGQLARHFEWLFIDPIHAFHGDQQIPPNIRDSVGEIRIMSTVWDGEFLRLAGWLPGLVHYLRDELELDFRVSDP